MPPLTDPTPYVQIFLLIFEKNEKIQTILLDSHLPMSILVTVNGCFFRIEVGRTSNQHRRSGISGINN